MKPLTLADLIAIRVSRRGALKGLFATTAWVAGCSGGPAAMKTDSVLPKTSAKAFSPISSEMDARLHVPEGYTARTLIRWGDPVLSGAPAFDPDHPSPRAQAAQFGTNNDFIAYMPLPRGSQNPNHGLLCVNHEYSYGRLMFPTAFTDEKTRVDLELNAVGHSVVEVERGPKGWAVVPDSAYARRLMAVATPTRVQGPAAGHRRLQTPEDPTGALVDGTFANCAGGVTPWGTVLTAEENFDKHFMGSGAGTAEARNHGRFDFRGKAYQRWGNHYPRFDLDQRPTEANRYGWVVEFDPYDPQSVPVKRTALGRFLHECATTVLAPDGRVVVYSGDDRRNEYLYRFVTEGRYHQKKPDQNRDLLDTGTLSVARFSDDGTLRWLPLVFGEGPLVPENGFADQGDVVIETRRAADLVGATPMDRPEDIEIDPVYGRVYVMLTENKSRDAADGANPRSKSKYGHVLELQPPMANDAVDHAAPVAKWSVFLLAGDPADPASGARYGDGAGPADWLANPDNAEFDGLGDLWIATDGMAKTTGKADGLFRCAVQGPDRGVPRRFAAVPKGAELTGPRFTPDSKTLFFSIQHPGAGSSYEAPSTRWPDFDPKLPPRSSVVVVTKDDGDFIGR